MAILPWYLELLGLAGSGSAILRVFRLARVVRIFKLGKCAASGSPSLRPVPHEPSDPRACVTRYAAGLQMFARTLLASADAVRGCIPPPDVIPRRREPPASHVPRSCCFWSSSSL